MYHAIVLALVIVVLAECCPLDSEIEVLEWLDNPNAFLRGFKQETEDLEWLNNPFAHVSDVRRANYAVEKEQELVPLQIKKMEQFPAEDVMPTSDRYAVSVPQEEQAPEQVSQEEQKLMQLPSKPANQQQPEQVAVSGQPEYFLGHHHTTLTDPSPPAEQQPEVGFIAGTKPGQVLEEEQTPEKVKEKPQEPQKSEQYPTDKMNTEQPLVDKKKYEYFNNQHHHARPTLPVSIQMEKKLDQIPVVLEQVLGKEQKTESVLVEEPKPEQGSAKEQKPEQMPVEQEKPKHVPVVSEQVPVAEQQPEQVTVAEQQPEQVPVAEQQPEQVPVAEQQPEQVPVAKLQPEQVPVVQEEPEQVPAVEGETEQIPLEQTKPEQGNTENPVVSVDQQKPEQAVGTEVPSTILTLSVQTQKPNHSSSIGFEESGCFWSGTSPFCRGKCGTFYKPKIVNKTGDGKRCLIGFKKLCCPVAIKDFKSLVGEIAALGRDS